MNLGFNYHKSRNFDQILTAAGNLSYASQNKPHRSSIPLPMTTAGTGWMPIIEADESHHRRFWQTGRYGLS
jgi:hypothetical protein